jgi:hypothetical protein
MSSIDNKLHKLLYQHEPSVGQQYSEHIKELISEVKALLPGKPTIYLGDGNILIRACCNKEKSLIGIEIGEAVNGPYEIGNLLSNVEPENNSCLIRILSSNPKSLQSVIDCLIRAQELFKEEDQEGIRAID